MTSRQVSIVGGGYTGLAAAYELRKHGAQVVVYEREDAVGGLAGTFEIAPGNQLEKFYHHWFTSDQHVFSLLRELGLEEHLTSLSSNTGFYHANKIFRLSSPLDLLTFSPLPILDRIRTGMMALAARRVRNWQHLESLSAQEWITGIAGQRSYQLIWKPLFEGKFGVEAENVSAVWFWNKLKLRGSSRDRKGSEVLVYFKGGFGAATDLLHQALEKQGVVFKTATKVQRICVEQGAVSGLQTSRGFDPAESVLCTTALPDLLEMTPDLPEDFCERIKQIRFLGNVCLVLQLERSLSSTYWLNVADPEFPFVGVIEHTNFDRPENYGGSHIIYLSKYLPTSDPLYQKTTEELLEFSIPHLQKMFPAFSSSWVQGAHLWRAPYSQPVITRHYSKLIPPERLPIDNLWLSTMAQIYPEDRGTNYAVRNGRKVAQMIIAEKTD